MKPINFAQIRSLLASLGEEGVRGLLSGELVLAEKEPWTRDKKGESVHLSVTSNGKSRGDWVDYLREKGYRVGVGATEVLDSRSFVPTKGVKIKVVILKGSSFGPNPSLGKVLAFANRHGLKRPSIETACLIRDKFSDEDIKAMGFGWIITVHEPVREMLLGADRGSMGRWLDVRYAGESLACSEDDGFAFVV